MARLVIRTEELNIVQQAGEAPSENDTRVSEELLNTIVVGAIKQTLGKILFQTKRVRVKAESSQNADVIEFSIGRKQNRSVYQVRREDFQQSDADDDEITLNLTEGS